MQFVIKLFLAGLLLCMASLSHAACTSVIGGINANTTFLALNNTSISMPARDAPLITPISPWVSGTFTAFTGCAANVKVDVAVTATTAASGGNVISSYTDPSDGVTYSITQATGASAGVGYIIGVGPDSSHITPYKPNDYNNIASITPSGTTLSFFAKLRLIRFAPITSNTINVGATSWIWTYVSTKNSPFLTAGLNPTTTSFTFPTTSAASCSVNTSNITVNLPQINAQQLATVGATAASVPFNISINCPNPVNVYMTMTDNSQPTLQNNYITAASSSTSQGVAVQVQQNGVPLTMGADSSAAGNPGQFLVGTALNGMQTIPFTANYLRTGNLGGGTLKAVATFTMSYQ